MSDTAVGEKQPGLMYENNDNPEDEEDEEAFVEHTTCFGTLGFDHPIRLKCRALVHHPKFDQSVSTLVFLNCIFLAMWLPGQPDSHPMNVASSEAELYFTIIFTMEVIVKVIGFGFVWHPYTYLRDNWNRLDFFVVVFAWLQYIPGRGALADNSQLLFIRMWNSLNSRNEGFGGVGVRG